MYTLMFCITSEPTKQTHSTDQELIEILKITWYISGIWLACDKLEPQNKPI